MRIAIMGSGGLGGYFGGMLARAGEDVHFIARGPHLEAMRSNGLTVKTSSIGEFTIPVNVTDDPSEIETADLVMMCVKTYDTESAAQLIRPLIGSDTVVISVQNGIENEENIGRVIGSEHVLGCMCYVTSNIESPGVVKEIFCQDISLGEPEGGPSSRVDELANTLEGAGLPAKVPPDINTAIWGKFLAISAYSAVCCVTRVPAGTIKAHPETESLFWGALDEGIALADAAGVTLPEGFKDSLQIMTSGIPPIHRASMYFDLDAGKPMELEDLVGVVVRLGGKYGVPTPLNFAMYAALKPYANGTPEIP